MYTNQRTDKEINRVLNWACEGEDNGSGFPGMSYEQGVKAAIEWMVGNIPTPPDED